MIDIKTLEGMVENHLPNQDHFLVGIKCSPSNEIEVSIDSEKSVTIDACAALSRALEAELEAITEDFALTVTSAGIGQPLRVLRQYRKLTGKPIEVLLRDGMKIVAMLREVSEEGITVSYTEKVSVEGRKRKVETETVRKYSFAEIKATTEFLDFK